MSLEDFIATVMLHMIDLVGESALRNAEAGMKRKCSLQLAVFTWRTQDKALSVEVSTGGTYWISGEHYSKALVADAQWALLRQGFIPLVGLGNKQQGDGA